MKTHKEFHVRRANAGDETGLAKLWTQFLQEQSALDDRFVVSQDAPTRWKNDFQEWVVASVHGLYVAEIDEELVGFASVHLWYPAPIYEPALEAYLDELFVVESCRGWGIGTSLLESVKDWASIKNARRIRIGVLHANERGLKFWKKQRASPFVETLFIEL